MDNVDPTPLQQWAGVSATTPRATLAVVFTDIIDSTTLARRVGDARMFDLLVDHFDFARIFSEANDGFEIKLIGDAYMVAFRTADAALQFAMAFLRNTGDPQVAIRAGIHVGQVRIREDDIYGLMVNYAARLSHVKVRGDVGIFISSSAKRDIESEYGANPEGFQLMPVRSETLKGFDAREQVWQVWNPEIRAARRARLEVESGQKTPTSPTVTPAAQSRPPVWTPTLSPRIKPTIFDLLPPDRTKK